MSTNVSYASGPSQQPLLGMTLGDKFDEIVAQYPNHDAIVSIHQNIRLTYSELSESVNELA